MRANIQFQNSVEPGIPPLQSVRLIDQMRERIRYMHYSLSTEKVYQCRVLFSLTVRAR